MWGLMNLREIARAGMIGRKRDTRLIQLVVTLTFSFILIAVILQGSIQETKFDKRKELYGSWHAAYLNGNYDVYSSFITKENIDKLAYSKILGVSDEVGIVGTFNESFLDLANLTLYQGNFPQNKNEIMIELNQMNGMGHNYEIGQKITIELSLEVVNKQYAQEIQEIYANADAKDIYLLENRFRENPSITKDDTEFVLSSEYLHFFTLGEASDSDTIRNNGLLMNQEAMFRKEFIISGIISTYTDKWDNGGHALPNAYITDDAGEELSNLFYNNGISDLSDYQMKYNTFIYSKNKGIEIYDLLKSQYPDMPLEGEELLSFMMRIWNDSASRYTDAEKEKVFQYYNDIAKELENNNEDIYIPEVAKNVGDSANFRKNSFTYINSNESVDNILTTVILVIVFITTVCSISQIFLVQMKRRTRKIALLKSIGATKGQLLCIIGWEGFYLLRFGLLLGTSIGFALSIATIELMKLFGKGTVSLHIPFDLLVIGIFLGILAFMIGIILPSFMIYRIPLVGNISIQVKHNSKRKKKSSISYQNFTNISLRYLKVNWKREIISFGLCFLIIGIIVICIYLTYFSLRPYEEEVIENNKPDYVIEAIYGESQNKIKEFTKDINSLSAISKVDTFKYGNRVFLWSDKLKNDNLLDTYKELLPSTAKDEYFGENIESLLEQADWIRNSYFTRYYGVDMNEELYQKLIKSISIGSINEENFAKGKEVILLIPQYQNIKSDNREENYVYNLNWSDSSIHSVLKDSGKFHTSYHEKYKKLYKKNELIQLGDTLKLTIDNEKIEGVERLTSYNTVDVTVGGIIYYFVEEGVWPFSKETPYYTVIGSMNGMEELFTKTEYGLIRITIEQINEMIKILYPNSYGRTSWSIYKSKTDNPEVLDAQLNQLAKEHGFQIQNYRESNDRLYIEVVGNALLIILLGISTSAICFMILYNLSLSSIEQEKYRIGILQSLGITKKQFIKQYAIIGFIRGIVAFSIFHLFIISIFAIFTALTSKIQTRGIPKFLEKIYVDHFWSYPFEIHSVMGIFFCLLIVFFNVITVYSVVKRYPIENIRG